MTSTISIPLTELLLRPSTLRRFTKRGFESTDEIEESRANGGINLLASELDVSLQEAAGLIREVQGCLGSYQQSKAKSRERNDNSVGDGDGGSRNDKENTTLIDPNNSKDTKNYPRQTQNFDDGIVTAYDMLHGRSREDGKKHHRRKHIVTFCRPIDDLIGGGIALGEVTEIAGMPGTGKTQLATQLSVLARLPHIYGGVEGKTLYVDAEGSFLAERAHSMAKALCHHVCGRVPKRDTQNIPVAFSTEGILDSIDVFRVHDEAALLATLYSLRHYIEAAEQSMENDSLALPVRLIVIDSIAFHFRAVTPTDPSYYVQRTKTLTALAAYLGDLARRHNLAVVVINQMTTKIGSGSSGTSVVPALGESWAHATATRLLLSKQERFTMEEYPTNNNDDDDESMRRRVRSDLRTCSLIKSAHKPNGRANYQIFEEGIRGVPGDRERNRGSGGDTSGSNKRSRTN